MVDGALGPAEVAIDAGAIEGVIQESLGKMRDHVICGSKRMKIHHEAAQTPTFPAKHPAEEASRRFASHGKASSVHAISKAQ